MMTSEAPLVHPRPHGVLVVDDDADVREVLHEKLRQEGFSVWLAADGREALDVYHNHCETIDVALLDVRMPGLDGPQTLAALQKVTPQIRCCFMSGCLGRHSEEKLRDLGAAAVFSKPFWPDGVAHVLGELVRNGKCSMRPSGGSETLTTKEASL